MIKYHNRLYILDQQVHFLTRASMKNIGRSMSRRYLRCMDKMAEAMRRMLLSGVHEDDLRLEWQKQVQTQTKSNGMTLSLRVKLANMER